MRSGDWQEGFQADHAAVDALYAADMAQHYKLSRASQSVLILTAGSLTFVLKRADAANESRIATHALAKELRTSDELDNFLAPLWPSLADPARALEEALGMLPVATRSRVMLHVSEKDFHAVKEGGKHLDCALAWS